MRTAALFPGQGSHTHDMRETLERERADLLALALAELGDDLFERVAGSTAAAQPAIYCASLAGWARLGAQGGADVVAGHSLGEISALAAAGAIDEADGLALVALRGRAMERASQQAGGGAMLALRAGIGQADPLAERYGLNLANDNSPQQVVLSGAIDRVDLAVESARADGLVAKRLPVAAAFHSPAMAGARDELAAALADVALRRPSLPVFSCVTAQPIDDVRRRLAEGLTAPVRWRETLVALHEGGAGRFVEVGPGKVLMGLVRRTLRDVEAVGLEIPEAVGA